MNDIIKQIKKELFSDTPKQMIGFMTGITYSMDEDKFYKLLEDYEKVITHLYKEKDSSVIIEELFNQEFLYELSKMFNFVMDVEDDEHEEEDDLLYSLKQFVEERFSKDFKVTLDNIDELVILYDIYRTAR